LIELHRNGELVLGDTADTVRHLDVVNHVDGARLFQAGVEFQPFENASDHPAEEHVVRDRVVIAASLEAALVPNSPGLYLNAPGLESERVRAASGVVEFDARLLSLTISSSPGWEPGDVCRVVFELGGTQHVFWSSVLEVSNDEAAPEIVLTFPKAVAARRCRNTQRFKPPSEQPVSMTLTAPLLRRTIETDALDITASGASFAIDGQSDLLPIGTRLAEVEVNFPHGASFQGSARVRSLHAINPDGGTRLKCGIEFEDLHPVERAELADYVVRCVRPEVSSGLDSNFDEIWSFLKKSGFLYPEKLRQTG
jgi:c-di-GMP-binding flagellar brake protein YcgR